MQLLPLDDPRWATYRSGFNRLPTDVSPVARRLAAGEADEFIWSILWEDLHHQGDLSRGRRLLARAYLDFTHEEALRFLRDQIGYEPDERD